MRANAFTLAELLISLAILGVVATFTIPKVLNSQQNLKHKAIAKEAIASIVQAYQLYSQSTPPTSATKPINLLPYLNYVKYDTSASIYYPFSGTGNCDSASPCIFLHNGALIQLYNISFSG